jgi:hypothetical protein
MRVDGGGINSGVVNVGLRVIDPWRAWPGRLSDLNDESITSCVLGEDIGDGEGESDDDASSRYAADRTRLFSSNCIS